MEERGKRLALKCQCGDQEAFRELVEIYKKPVFNLALRMLNNREDAADVAQETFLRVFRHIGQFNPQHKFSSWTYTITSRLCLDRLRRMKNISQGINEDLPDRNPLPEEQVIINQMRHDLNLAIANLPEKYRLVVVLRHVNELSYEEIAAVLGIPVNTVKTHLFRGREMLKQIIGLTKAGEYGG